MADAIPAAQIAVADLPRLTGWGKSRLYDIFGQLKITPRRIGRAAFVSPEQLQLLLRCRDAMAQGMSLAQFIDLNPPEPLVEPLPESSGLVADSSAMPTAEQLLSALLAMAQQPQQQLPPPDRSPDPLEQLERRLRLLQQLSDGAIQIPNSELAMVLGVASSTLRSQGQHFSRYGFDITRVPGSGRSVTWKVSRASDPSQTRPDTSGG